MLRIIKVKDTDFVLRACLQRMPTFSGIVESLIKSQKSKTGPFTTFYHRLECKETRKQEFCGTTQFLQCDAAM